MTETELNILESLEADSMRYFLRRNLQESDARDCTQTVLLRTVRRMQGGRDIDASYITTTLRSVLRKWSGASKRDRELLALTTDRRHNGAMMFA